MEVCTSDMTEVKAEPVQFVKDEVVDIDEYSTDGRFAQDENQSAGGDVGNLLEEGSRSEGYATSDSSTPFACDMCDYKTTKRCYLTRHRSGHTRRYPCPSCDYAASRRHHLVRHTEEQHGAAAAAVRYACRGCDFSTARRLSLRQHEAMAHRLATDGPPIALACPVCDYRTVRRDRLQRHMARHTGSSEEPPSPLSEVTGDQPIEAGNRTEPPPFELRRSPPKSRQLMTIGPPIPRLSPDVDHPVAPSPPRSPVGDERPTLPTSRGWRRAHRLYGCDAAGCGYTTSHRQHMERHEAKHGATERVYPCQQCDYAATTLEYLAKHKVKHAGTKPHACTECDYAAARRAQLSRHIASVHRSRGHGRLTCPSCAFPARSPSHLAAHRLTHPRLACPVCRYTTDTAIRLVRHVARTHAAPQRLHDCPVCDYAGARREHVANHVRSAHTREAPHACDDCGFAGLRASSLKLHRAKAHPLLAPDAGDDPTDDPLYIRSDTEGGENLIQFDRVKSELVL